MEHEKSNPYAAPHSLAAHESSARDTSSSNRLVLAVHVVIIVVMGILTIADWASGMGRAWMFFGAFFVSAVVSWALGLGWIVPCIVCGTFAGMTFDARPKSGPIEHQAWQTVVSIGFGFVLGMIVGYLLDVGTNSRLRLRGP